MRIDLDAKIKTKDGHRAGSVQRVILDPASNEINEYVVSTGGLLGHDVVVSREMLEAASREGDEIVLDLTKDELDRLEPYAVDAYAPPPYGFLAPSAYDYPTAAYLFPLASTTRPANESNEPERPAITNGMHVRDERGDVIGSVREVIVDEQTGTLREIVVEEGGPIGGKATWSVAADQIDVGNGEVHLVPDARRSPTREERRR
ncbi:MAG TPA: PRC-barrel domain-containing protein [Candidatus Limnocylindria bacterium]